MLIPMRFAMPRLVHLSLPSPARQGINLAAAGVRLLTAAATGSPILVSEEMRAARAAACRACEHYWDGRCALCGCCAASGRLVFDKVKYATERCPAKPARW